MVSDSKTTIFEALREDHDTQRTLMALLVKTSGDSDGRTELFARLREALTRHAAAEERHFYRLLMEHDPTMQKARHGVAEHQEIDERLAELENVDPTSPAWQPRAEALCERVTHHLDEEEHEAFQQAGKVLTEGQKIDLARRYRKMMEQEPT